MVPLLLALAGCAEQAAQEHEIRADQAKQMSLSPALARVPPGPAAMTPAARAQAAPDAAPIPAKAATAGRKIIYNATVDLVTEDLSRLEAGLRGLVATSGGYIADSDRTGAAGSSRRGTWKVRVPVDGFDALLRGVSGLGELVGTRSESEDVGAEFFDLEARQTAKKVEEARLLKHLSDSTGRLEEILAVERELARVRSELERMQGRLVVLANQTTLATITVSASEIKGYVPPNPPTLAQRVGRTFEASVANLRAFGEGLLLVAVALAPWSPVIVAGVLLAVVIFRWLARRARAEWHAIVESYRAAVAARSARG